MSKKITFTIGRDGIVTNQVEGVKGEACDTVSLPFLEKLGGNVTSYAPTEEYCEKEKEQKINIEIE